MTNNDDFWKEEYKQLSEDWRSRDRMTWQMPAFLVTIGGALLVSTFTDLGNNQIAKNSILLIALLFNWVFTIFLTRNIYLQGLGDRVLKEIKDAINKPNSLKKIIRRAGRVPLHDNNYGYREAFFDFFNPTSSVCLLSLCMVITGILFQMIWCPCFNSWLWLIGGILASFANIYVVFTFSHRFSNNEEIVYAKDKKRRRLRFTLPIMIFVTIFLIVLFVCFHMF